MNDAMSHPSRRRFIKTGLAAAAPLIIPASALGAARPAPSERIVMGAIGIGGMGGYDLRGFLGHDVVQVVAVCDVDAQRLAAATSNTHTKRTHPTCNASVMNSLLDIQSRPHRERTGNGDIDAPHSGQAPGYATALRL